MVYDEYHVGHDDAHLANNIGAIMGGIGCIAVITMIFRYQALRKTTSTRLVFFQTFTYLVESVFNVALPSDQPRACTIQAVVVEFAMLSSALWGCVMIYVLYSIMVRAPTSRLAYDPNSELHWFHLVCWGLPLPMTIAPLITGDFGQVTNGSGWCWIVPDTDSAKVLRLAHYGMFWVICLFTAVMSAVVWWKLRVLSRGTQSTRVDSLSSGRSKQSVESAMFHRLIFFPIGQMLLILPISVYRFWQYSDSAPPHWLLAIGICMARSYGMLNLLVYVFQRPVQKEILKDARRLTAASSSKSEEFSHGSDANLNNVKNFMHNASTVYGGGHEVTMDIDEDYDEPAADPTPPSNGGKVKSSFRITTLDKDRHGGSGGSSFYQDFRQDCCISPLMTITVVKHSTYDNTK